MIPSRREIADRAIWTGGISVICAVVARGCERVKLDRHLTITVGGIGLKGLRDRRPQRQVTQQAVKRVERVLRKAGTARCETGADGQKRDPLTEWEAEFLGSLKDRLETFGSAFADPNLGAEEEALSIMQNAKLHEVSRNVRRKTRSSDEEKGSAKPDGEPKKGLKKNAGFHKKSPLKRRTSLRRKPKQRDIGSLDTGKGEET